MKMPKISFDYDKVPILHPMESNETPLESNSNDFAHSDDICRGKCLLGL